MSYCECDYDYDPPKVFRAGLVKRARKQHRCDECNGPILAGESYKKRGGVWQETFETYRQCALCVELEEWAKISVPCFCWDIFGTLHERVQEMVQDVAPTIPGFFFEYGRRMVKIRARAKKEPPSVIEGDAVSKHSALS
jgi:hypothetical protein